MDKRKMIREIRKRWDSPEKYWNNLLEELDEIKQYLKND